MSIVPRDFDCQELDPIDIVETLAEERLWDFDRIAADQIAMAIQGTWGTYSVTVAWSARDETLRLICAFEIVVPPKRLSAAYATMCLANDKCWTGAFVFWPHQKMMAYRYGLNLTGDAEASSAQINDMVRSAVAACERFYLAFQEICGRTTPEAAIAMAINETYGRA